MLFIEAVLVSNLWPSFLPIRSLINASTHPHWREAIPLPILLLRSGKFYIYNYFINLYFQSRRDMITRHMRTHLRPDGTPMPFSEIQLPIGQLSINQPTTPDPHRHGSPPPAPDLSALLLAQQQQQEQKCLPQLTIPPIASAQPTPNTLTPNPDTILETAAAIFSNAASGSITPQMMLNTLGNSLDGKPCVLSSSINLQFLAQIPTLGFRRSTPNIFQSLESASNSASALNAAISRLLAPTNMSTLSVNGPSLSRQSSIGGLGFDPTANI